MALLVWTVEFDCGEEEKKNDDGKCCLVMSLNKGLMVLFIIIWYHKLVRK